MTGLGFLRNKQTRILTIALLAQAGLFYGLSKGEKVPTNEPLATVPQLVGPWKMANEGVVEKEVQDVLKADELLTRTYTDEQASVGAHLFVAYFKSQRTGQIPHSPKNCLPGAGWTPSVSDTLNIDIPGRAPIEVNRYVVAKGDSKSVVMYWYQSRDRVVASEYTAKFYVVADAIRYNRTDTALVRVTVPVVNDDSEKASETAVRFIQTMFGPLRAHFPA